MSMSSHSQTIEQKIHALGANYLHKYPKETLAHSNQPVAKKLQNYNCQRQTTQQEHQKFLLTCFFALPDFQGELATTIKTLFSTELGITLDSTFLMHHITQEAAQNIGQDYLDKYPTPSAWYSLFPHKNQQRAQRLKDHTFPNSSRNASDNPAAFIIWMHLVNIYSTLPNSTGKIASAISKLIENVFEINITQYEAASEQVRKISTWDIATGQLAPHIRDALKKPVANQHRR